MGEIIELKGKGVPKVGVYICHCGFNIASKVRVDEVVDFAATLPNVVVARSNKYTCSDPGQEVIRKDIKEMGLDRVVVASCTPLLHEHTFRKTVETGGLNPFLFHMVNIREDVSWVTDDGDRATEKAKALVAAGVRRVLYQKPLEKRRAAIKSDVLIIGGGIGGITAALDIADSGKKVTLVEREPTIGGVMAKFDKTFPTLDCAACILTPKMTAVASHPNIKLLTFSEVKDVSGYIGDFRASIVKKPRRVIESKCTGCGECANVCPVYMPNAFDENLGMRKATYKPFAQAVPNVHTIEKTGTSPCTYTCPAGINAHGYVALASAGKYDEAFNLILESTPLVATLGRACYAPCEEECTRGELEGTVRIRRLKRFIADRYYENHPEPEYGPPDKELDKKVAIVGSGPAGLTAAYFLRKMGYQVTIFEKEPRPGGMLRVGIPEYRLPNDVLDRDIKNVLALGVGIQTYTEVKSLDDLRKKGFDAIFLATGTHGVRKMDIEGENLSGVVNCMEFLTSINYGKKTDLTGKTILVVGGGNAALDSARAALRLGARKVTIQYRRSRAEMPAFPEEIDAAEKEGITISYLTTPVKFEGEGGKLKYVQSVQMQLGEPDDTGRRKPIPIPGSESIANIDMAIIAIGLMPTTSPWAEQLNLNRDGTIQVDPETLQTSLPHVFAGGDVVLGPSIIVNAIGQGRRAAHYIDKYLKGEDLKATTFVFRSADMVSKHDVLTRSIITHAMSLPKKELPVDERITNFKEVEIALTEEEALKDTKRCLNCSVCSDCHLCKTICSAEAIDYGMKEEVIDVEAGVIIVTTGFKPFDPKRISAYGYGRFPNVYTSLEVERLVNSSGPTQGEVILRDGRKPERIGIIHCVGSRDKEYNQYCSKVCCMYSLKLAHLLKERTGADIYNFYIDMRTPGKGYEEFYHKLLEEGVHFVRGRVGEVTDWAVTAKEEGKLIIRVEDTLLGMVRRIPVDMVVLSVALEPQKDADDVRRLLNLSCSSEGFFLERHPKLAPVATFTDGIYIAGACQGPKDIPETVAQASAAAAQALSLVDRGYVELEPNTAYINSELCSGCHVCIAICPYGAITYNSEKKVAESNEVLCKGCGSCVAACPSGAIDQHLFENEQIINELEGVLSYV
ncbi:MAG: FAD-dependent oxidoreductase [Syntrophorhabdaceae bacterium]|nr:FAD-dependent oxidoreductase [Syntrophorhabdaceae bacterium]